MHDYEKKIIKLALGTTAQRMLKHETLDKLLRPVTAETEAEKKMDRIEIALSRMVEKGWLTADTVKGVVLYTRTQGAAKAAALAK